MGLSERDAIARTRRWIERVVIELGLCPFAAEPFEAGRVRFALSEACDGDALLGDLDTEMVRLLAADPCEIETTLLIHPWAFHDFDDYNDFLDPAEALLRARGHEGVLQLASFHPRYRFAEAPPDDPAHFTNRSPCPMLHLLREASVSRAVDGHPDPGAIPERNAERLRGLGREALIARLVLCAED